jgi:hypothetical protein
MIGTQRVLVNRVLRRIVGTKREVVRGAWRNLHKEELHNLKFPSDLIRMIKLEI